MNEITIIFGAQRGEFVRALLQEAKMSEATLHPLAGDASFRRYVRVRTADRSAMLMDAPPDKEDVRPYIAVAEYFHSLGYSFPGILAMNPEQGLILLEDFGDDSFTRLLAAPAYDATRECELYEAAVDMLAQWYALDVAPLSLATYDQALMMREVSLFTQWFLPQLMDTDTCALHSEEFTQIWRALLEQVPLEMSRWVHRDYHADNLLWLPQRIDTKRVGVLDFQDGVCGDAAYDMVSLLEDARRDVPPALAQAMCARFVERTGCNSEQFYRAYALLGAQRNCKIIGIFARLAARDGKPHYLNYLPRVWRHLLHDVSHPILAPLQVWLDHNIPSSARGAITIIRDAKALGLVA